MTQTRSSRKRNHQELEEDGGGGIFQSLSKRREFNGQAELLRTNGGQDEVDGMERLRLLEAAGGEPSHSPLLAPSPKSSGAMISPSMHEHNQQFIASHHEQQQLHPTPCSPTSPHQIATHHLAGHHSAGSSSELHHGVPNVPVSPAHSPPGFSNSLSSSRYDDINRVLREAHFSRISRINGVELRPDELHL